METKVATIEYHPSYLFWRNPRDVPPDYAPYKVRVGPPIGDYYAWHSAASTYGPFRTRREAAVVAANHGMIVSPW